MYKTFNILILSLIILNITTAFPTNIVSKFQDLNHQQITTQSVANIWSLTGAVRSTNQIVSTCNSSQIVGGHQITSTTTSLKGKYEGLDTHNIIYMSLEIWILDCIDDQAQLQISFNSKTTNIDGICKSIRRQICGNPTLEDIGPRAFNFIIPHNEKTLEMEFHLLSTQTPIPPSYGVNKLSISIAVQKNQQSANEISTCFHQSPINNQNQPPQTHPLTCKCPIGYFKDGASDDAQCVQCSSTCQSCFGPEPNMCYTCKEGLILTSKGCVCPKNEDIWFDFSEKCFQKNILYPDSSSLEQFIYYSDSAIKILALSAIFYPELVPRLFALTAANKILVQLKNINIGLFPDIDSLYRLFDSRTAFNLGLPSTTDISGNMTKEEIPMRFHKFQYHSRFLVNYWGTLSTLLILMTVAFFLAFLIQLAERLEFRGFFKVSYQIKTLIRWNLALPVFFLNIDETMISTAFEFKNVNSYSTKTWFGLIFGILLLVFCAYRLIMNYIIIKKYFKIKDSPPRLEQIEKEKKYKFVVVAWSRFNSLYQGLETNKLSQLLFNWIITTRLIFLGLVIGYLDSAPTLQGILLLITSLLFMVYLIISRPLIKKYMYVEVFLYEIVVFLATITTIIMVSKTDTKTNNIAYSNKTELKDASNAIRVFHLFYTIIGLGFTIMYAIKGIIRQGLIRTKPIQTNNQQETSIDTETPTKKVRKCKLLRSFFRNAPKDYKEVHQARIDLFFKSIFNHQERAEVSLNKTYQTSNTRYKSNQVAPASVVLSRLESDRKLKDPTNIITPNSSVCRGAARNSTRLNLPTNATGIAFYDIRSDMSSPLGSEALPSNTKLRLQYLKGQTSANDQDDDDLKREDRFGDFGIQKPDPGFFDDQNNEEDRKEQIEGDDSSSSGSNGVQKRQSSEKGRKPSLLIETQGKKQNDVNQVQGDTDTDAFNLNRQKSIELVDE